MEMHCNRCHWQGYYLDLEIDCVYAGSLEEPPELKAHCPICSSDDINESVPILCVGCEDEIVKNEGDYCTECMTCHAESIMDAERGH